MNLRLLVIPSVGVLLLDLVLLRRRHREVFLPLTNGRVPHKILEARRGEDAHQADDVVADVEDRNPRAGRDEHGRARVHHSLGVPHAHPSGPSLQKEDFVCIWVPMSLDYLAGCEVCRKEDQMRRTAIFRVDLPTEGFSRIRVSGPPSHNPPFAFVLLEDQGGASGLRWLLMELTALPPNRTPRAHKRFLQNWPIA